MARSDGSDLLAQVYASPADDGPRQVYADWLQEHDDPRGELIALQIARHRGRAKSGQRKREDELLEKHGLEWAKPLGVRTRQHVYALTHDPSYVFERGFPAIVSIGAWNTDPAWSTVRACNVPPASDDCHTASLREITAAQNKDVTALATLTKPLPIERFVWGYTFDTERAWVESNDPTITLRATDAFARCPMPSLRRLELSSSIVGAAPSPGDLAWALERSTLRELAIPSCPLDLATWIAALDGTALERVEIVTCGSLAYGWHAAARVVVERVAGRLSKLTVLITRSVNNVLGELTGAFTAFDGELSSVRVAIATLAEWNKSGTARGALRRRLDRMGVDATIEKASR